MNYTAAHAIVNGVVQGVGFRYFVYARARDLHVTGYVRNRPDGTVEVWAEGDRGAVQALLDLLKTGPPAARVTDIKMSWEKATGQYAAFEIRG
ncbi:MAG: acylphosphatase [Candidatus Zixiibacteriota bacterium]|nr:MAG: acylphosphatase [candidate division Zixibacteria bacterium]